VQPQVELLTIDSRERAALYAAADRYLAELKEHREIAVGATDAASHPYFPLLWSEAGRHPFWICADRERVGFALVRRIASELTTLSQMSEFFVETEHRRGGVGGRTAAAVFRRFPGPWELQVHWRNHAARHFWARCVELASGGVFEVEEAREVDGRRLEYRFSALSASGEAS
jgi:predicted acetyltransferase